MVSIRVGGDRKCLPVSVVPYDVCQWQDQERFSTRYRANYTYSDPDAILVCPFFLVFVESNASVDDLVQTLERILDGRIFLRSANDIREERRVKNEDGETALAHHVDELWNLDRHRRRLYNTVPSGE